ncbi:hypothetical protein QA640_22830 [Bradyrhizobium sp. CB82]|uniref:hypothetical protein n=1 Tax=Bradyrhizobium sp. CB82 TaxID=3039159 RepID=UPI0024B05700|nr:hypothetical protein [Bradyrhizobium sp. CB82]WFU37330.1 hypothetical protein QA640_22830 [Bradyrhizobium sp. CB82]
MASIEPLIRFPVVRAALGFATNEPLHATLRRFGIRPVELNSRVKGLRESDYTRLLERAMTQKECA